MSDAETFDLEARDPNGLNQHLKVRFEDVIGEPDHTQSIDCVWRNSYKCFNLWKKICYLINTTICGIFIAMCWGCEFACISFYHIWEVTPCLRVCEIECGVCQRMYGMCVHCLCDPCCDACGNIFNAFKKSETS